MSPPETTTRTDLVLRGRVGGIPLSLTGTIDEAPLAEFSGSVSIERSLGSLLDQLRDHFGEAVEKVRKPLRDSRIEELTLNRLAFGYRAGTPKYVQAAATLTADEVQCHFVLVRATQKNDGFMAGLNLRLGSKTPLKNEFLSSLVGEISLGDLGVYYASKPFQDLSLLTQEQEAGLLPLERPETKLLTFPQGWTVFAEILIGGMNLFEAPPAAPGPPAEPPPAPKAPAVEDEPGAASGGLQKWFPVKKTFGPLHVERVGVEWRDAKLGLLLDAGVDLLGLSVGLLGLALRVKPGGDDGLLRVRRPTPRNIEFGLDGMELGFKQGPVEISGGLLRTGRDGQVEFTGTALIKTEVFTISGFGSYTVVNGQPSLFLFALLDKDLGGPPCFHVTGLAAGFGYNRTLILPPIEEVQEFALVKAAVKPEEFRDLGTIRKAIAEVGQAALGEYWLAAGVRFTSFEMIESFALLAVSFGTDTVISILGLSRITVPKARGLGQAEKVELPPLAYAEMALKASLRPESGVLMAEARLTPNSYVFTKDCKLTGGFAFYAWFKDLEIPGKDPGSKVRVSAGDFVVTLGGYHPRFHVPEHYPVVPRLGLTWQVSPSLRVAGQVYFALTPTCLMAGGRLSALFQEGGLRAWFDAYADFFIAWQPLQYSADVGVRIGVAYQGSVLGISVNSSVEISAEVHLWGPPFAGKAEVHWTIISFTIYFGESREKPEPEPLKWGPFAGAFLPPNNDSLTIAVVGGVLKEVKDQGQDYLIVNPYQLTVLVKSAVPSTRISATGQTLTGMAKLGIRPMQITELEDSGLEVKVSWQNQQSQQKQVIAMEATGISQNVPGALWSQQSFDPRADQKPELIEGVLTGVQLRPPATPKAQNTCDFDERVGEEQRSEVWNYRYAPAGQAYDPDQVIGHITSPGKEVEQSRYALLQLLGARGWIDTEKIPKRDIIDEAYHEMQLEEAPVECGVGMLPQIRW